MLLAVDQGTTNTKALLIDRGGATVFRAASSAPLQCSPAGEISQDPEALWASTLEVIRASLEYAKAAGDRIDGLCLANQRETALAWDRVTGQPLAQAISWQCRRSANICVDVSTFAAEIQQKTGLPLDPLLSATKWVWMLRNEPRVQAGTRAGTLALGTVDSWLLYRITGGQVHATDATNASRTGLLNLESVCWDESLLGVFELREEWLPQVMPSASTFGVMDSSLGFGEIPIVAIAGDSHAAMLGHADLQAGALKATYGTGSSLMALTAGMPQKSEHLARTVAWTVPAKDLQAGTQYALEGNITISGAALEWVGQFLGLGDPASEAAQLAEQVSDADGLMFVPAMAGLGAPHWKARAAGSITGLRPHHRAAHMARAALDAIAMQVADVVDAMREEGRIEPERLLADGGATRNSTLMQLQADALGVPVQRSLQEELSALGAARLGGLTLQFWPDLASAHVLDRGAETFAPKLAEEDREAKRAAWQMALRRTLLEVQA